MTSGPGYVPQPLPLWTVEDLPPSTTRKRNPLLEVLGRACDDPSQAASDVWDGYIMSPTAMVCPFKWSRPGDAAELFCHKSKAERPYFRTHQNDQRAASFSAAQVEALADAPDADADRWSALRALGDAFDGTLG